MKVGMSSFYKGVFGTFMAGVIAGGLTMPFNIGAAWAPTKPVEFIIPAGQGGGADKMARLIQGIVSKHKLMDQPLVVINKSGGAGGEAFLYMREAEQDPHKIAITLSNLFTTPLATGIPFNWKDLTPVAMLALDEFVLWVNANSPYKTAKEFLNSVKSSPDGKFVMGGTGSKQEDQIIIVALENYTGKKIRYVPFKGGGTVAVQLVGGHVDATVNNPIEAVAHWRAGKVRPLMVFDNERMPYKDKIVGNLSWNSIPTSKEEGVDVVYLMLRGIFMPPGVTQEQVDFYIDLFKKVRETPEWKAFMQRGAFNQSFMTGKEYVQWLERAEKLHEELMKKAGFIKQ